MTHDTCVDALTLLARRGDGPMRARAHVALGTFRVEWAEDGRVAGA